MKKRKLYMIRWQDEINEGGGGVTLVYGREGAELFHILDGEFADPSDCWYLEINEPLTIDFNEAKVVMYDEDYADVKECAPGACAHEDTDRLAVEFGPGQTGAGPLGDLFLNSQDWLRVPFSWRQDWYATLGGFDLGMDPEPDGEEV